MKRIITLFVLILGIVSLFLEYSSSVVPNAFIITNTIDFLIVTLSLGQVFVELVQARHLLIYLRKNVFSLIFLALFVFFFSISKYILFSTGSPAFVHTSGIIIFRNAFILLKIFSRFQKLSVFFQDIVNRPSQTIIFSFVMVIFCGTLLLMMPFSSSTQERLPFIDCFFTATSAVCVTGLSIYDTSTRFSIFGQIILVLLIQIGGLGIMLLSFSVLFMFKRSISLENKMLVSYMVNEDDLGKIRSMAGKIILSTFLIEGVGALFLFITMRSENRSLWLRLFDSVFHSVSAFCNAGFSLRNDSLQTLSSTASLVIIGILIVLGSIGFSAIFDVQKYIMNGIASIRGSRKKKNISANTSMVLRGTALLLVSGMFLLYFTEHRNTLASMPVTSQYLHAFFQSITLRTAGFNSIPFDHLTNSTLIVMIIFMFIGGATGSTAGGIKINTIGIIVAYFRSYLKKSNDTIIRNSRVDQSTVINAFFLFFIGICIVNAAAFVLSFTEKQSYLPVLFEVVSAFATVGLSTGITAALSSFGKVIVILLMFFGRLGPLTILAAAASRKSNSGYRYSQAEIQIG